MSGYDNFCEVAGYNPDKVLSIFEFSLYTGFAGINVWMLGYPDTDSRAKNMPPEVIHRVEAFEGPHARTMIKAYLAKRRSFTGRLDAMWRKPVHIAGFWVLLLMCMFRRT